TPRLPPSSPTRRSSDLVVLHHVRRLAADEAPGGLSDQQLLQRFADKRDESAFAEIVRRHGAMVLGVCSRVLRDPHAAEDAFQTRSEEHTSELQSLRHLV